MSQDTVLCRICGQRRLGDRQACVNCGAVYDLELPNTGEIFKPKRKPESRVRAMAFVTIGVGVALLAGAIYYKTSALEPEQTNVVVAGEPPPPPLAQPADGEADRKANRGLPDSLPQPSDKGGIAKKTYSKNASLQEAQPKSRTPEPTPRAATRTEARQKSTESPPTSSSPEPGLIDLSPTSSQITRRSTGATPLPTESPSTAPIVLKPSIAALRSESATYRLVQAKAITLAWEASNAVRYTVKLTDKPINSLAEFQREYGPETRSVQIPLDPARFTRIGRYEFQLTAHGKDSANDARRVVSVSVALPE